MNLAALVGEPDVFLRDVFGRHRQVFRGAAGRFGELLVLEDLSALVATMNPALLRLVRAGKERPLSAVRRHGDPEDDALPPTRGIRAAIDDGFTLLIRSLHHTHGPVRDLAQQLSAEVGQPVQVNAFITPPGQQGVSMHYDVQDVFVLQVRGSKRWELAQPARALPREEDAFFSLTSQGRADAIRSSTPLDPVVLRDGDVLYLPRGTFHSPSTIDEESIHLTIAVPVPRKHDVLLELLSVSDMPWLRQHVDLDAVAGDVAAQEELRSGLLAAVRDALGEADLSDVLAAVRGRAYANAPSQPVEVLVA